MNINELDFENVGSWPRLYKVVMIVVVCLMLFVGFYYYVIEDQLKQLKKIEAKELTLKDEFRVKAALASNLEPYREQMKEIAVILEGLVNKLPSNKELASLLDDISFIGSNNGLQFKSINWGVKKQGELSEEVPISIQVVGTYDQLGKFSADIAALPRIVILENLRLKHSGENMLMLDVVAKTYRYKGNK
ncbi:pilus assembly protein PilP [Psychromonas sp. RZ22]|uniref:type 4a pilus biogenesis protein PilO n=1 Tax=Psychromonas algarum TaxID=2555643 RepID=UPI0010672221|nr:type 4a pilus biogenesis protein PilO [Psychromonas sp. RZ22]TEW53920.1 pilus assembly protein PilP [Psychromonas sp. RZ22]